jgi:hypothetical protein
MGALCCCCAGDEDGEDQKETEMKATISEADKKTLAISPKMSAPTINVKDRTYVSGHGLAIAAVPIEQDAAYWEWHIAVLTTLGLDVHLVEDIMFGVASKKDRKFYQELEENGAEKTGVYGMMMCIGNNAVREGVAVPLCEKTDSCQSRNALIIYLSF